MERRKQPDQATEPARLIEDVGTTLAARIAHVALAFVTGVVTARWLGPEDRGVFALVLLFAMTLTIFSRMGQVQAAVYFIRRERCDPSTVVSNLAAFALVVGLAAVAIGLSLSNWAASTLFGGVPAWMLMAVAPTVPLLLIENYSHAVLRATGRFRAFNLCTLAHDASLCALVLLAVVGLGGGVGMALAAVIAARVVAVATTLATVAVKTPLRWQFDLALLRRMLRFGLKSYVQVLAALFQGRIGTFFVAAFADPTQVALYVVGTQLGDRLLELPRSLGTALFPRLASASPERVHTMTALALRVSVLAGVLLAVAVTAFGPWAVGFFYGADYSAAAGPLSIVAWGIVSMTVYLLLQRNFTSRGRQQINIVAACVAITVNVLLNAWLTPRFGIIGAAWAMVGSYSIATVILLGRFLAESRLPLRKVLVVQRSDWDRVRRAAELRQGSGS